MIIYIYIESGFKVPFSYLTVADGGPQLPERCLMRGELRGVDAVPVGSQGCLASDVVLGGRHLHLDGVEPVQQSLRVRFELRV
eukprot:COSAG06_NODE_383_length_16525_cov_86.720017_5_plen_83_part_00